LRASREQLAELVAGKTVAGTWVSRDRYGRIVGWVMVDQGIWVNKVMVLAVCAWWFECYAPDEDQERKAQKGRMGDAVAADTVAPADFTATVERNRRKPLIGN